VRLCAAGGEPILDAVKLAIVDRPAGQRAVLHDNHVLLGALSSAYGASDGSDVGLASELGSGDRTLAVPAGSQWDVDLGGDSRAPGLFLEAGGGDGHDATGEIGIEVQRQNRWSQWVTIGTLVPHRSMRPFFVDSIQGRLVRLIFKREYLVRRLGRFDVSAVDTIQALAPLGAQHSRLGSDPGALGLVGGTEAALRPRESVVLRYQLPALNSGRERDYFLITRGRWAGDSQPKRVQLADMEAQVGSLPLAFDLRQSEPNPFNQSARIRFALPRASGVQLDVFDLQGRRIAKLADGFFPAGYHSIEWDGRAMGGDRVQAGVYVYRIQAGSFQARRKIVLMP
jgi:hypothetical protein